MKKLLTGLLLVAMLLSLVACGNPAGSNEDPSAGPTAPITDPAAPAEPDKAQVRILNRNPDLQSVWTALAQEYSQQTGTDVQIVTAQEDRPTLQRVSSRQELPENCADLSQTHAFSQLISPELTLRNEDGKVLAVADDIEVYGLMYNSTLLVQTANTRDDINSFTELTDVVYSITDAKDRLGFSAFARVDPDAHFALQLAALSGDSRNLVDLILHNTTCDPLIIEEGTKNDALQDFLDADAVFLLAGSSEHAVLDAIGSENIGVLPVYIGGENEDKQTLCVAARSYWCVDGSASAEDVQATVEFLEFLTTPRADGTVPADALGRMTPYRQATYVSNVPEVVLRAELAMGKEPVVCRYVTRVPQGLTEALIAYAADPSDANWAAIRTILDQT